MLRIVRHLALVICAVGLCAMPALAGTCAPIAEGRTFSTVLASSITISAADITLPTGNGTLYMLQIGAPASNGDVIYMLPASATTSTGIPINPGAFECVPLKSATTISAVAASGTQKAQIIAYFR